MKRTILATAITALFATTAHATTIYDADGTTVSIFGNSEVVMMKGVEDDATSDIVLDEAEIGFEVYQKVGNGFTLGTVVTLSGAEDYDDYIDGTDQEVTLDDTYVSIASMKWGTLTIGKQPTIFDDAGIGSDYQFGFSDFYTQSDSGDQVIKYKFDNDVFYAGIAYLKNEEADNSTDNEGFDLNFGVRFSGFDLTAFYADVDDSTIINVEARYALTDVVSLAISYATADNEDDDTIDAYGIAGVYQLDGKTTLAAGWANVDTEGDHVNDVYINASYAFSKFVNVYVELGASDKDDNELGYATGMQVSF